MQRDEGDIVGTRVWGVATEKSTMVAAVKAVIAAFNQALAAQPARPTPTAQGRTATSVVRVYSVQRKPVASGRGVSGLAGNSPGGSSSL
jgi:hypothetical protein